MLPTDDEVEDLLFHMDQDKSGKVDLSELLKQMANQVHPYMTKQTFQTSDSHFRFKYVTSQTRNMISKKPS